MLGNGEISSAPPKYCTADRTDSDQRHGQGWAVESLLRLKKCFLVFSSTLLF